VVSVMTAESLEIMRGFGGETGPVNEFITRRQFTCKCVACGRGTYDYEGHGVERLSEGANTFEERDSWLMEIIKWRLCFKRLFGTQKTIIVNK